MKRSISRSLLTSAILTAATAVLLSGCNAKETQPSTTQMPTEDELIQEVEYLADGEDFMYLGDGKFSSKERDLIFYERWEYYTRGSGEDDGPGYYCISSDAPQGSVGENPDEKNYYTVIYDLWADYISDRIESYSFDEASFTKDTDRKCRDICITATLFVSRYASVEDRNDIFAFCMNLRDFCYHEEAYHWNSYNFPMSIRVKIVLFDPDAGTYAEEKDFYLTAWYNNPEISEFLDYDWSILESDDVMHGDPVAECEHGELNIVVR